MKNFKNTRWLIGLLLLGLPGLIACEKKNHIREGMCIRGMPDTMSWAKCDEAGKRSLKKGDYSLARRYFLDAITRTEKLSQQDPRFTTGLGNLAKVYMDQGELAHAESILNRVLALTEMGKSDELQFAANLDSLGKIYQKQGNSVKAELYARRALGIRMKKLGSSHPLVVSGRKDLGSIYLEQGRVAEAVQLLDWEWLNENAALAADRGERDRALLYSTKALEKAEEFGQSDPRLTTSLNSLARTHAAQGHLAEAEALLKRAVAIHEKDKKPENHGLVASLIDLSGFYSNQGRFSEAEALLKRALDFRENKQDDADPDLALILSGMARLNYAQGRFAEMEDLLKRVLAIRLKKMEASDPEVISVQNNLIGFYMSQKRYAEAEQIFTRIIPIIRTNTTPVPKKIELFENYASLLQLTNRKAEAEKVIREYTGLVCSSDPKLITQRWDGFRERYCKKSS